MQAYIRHMILKNLQVFYIYNENNLHHFSIFYNISIFYGSPVTKCDCELLMRIANCELRIANCELRIANANADSLMWMLPATKTVRCCQWWTRNIRGDCTYQLWRATKTTCNHWWRTWHLLIKRMIEEEADPKDPALSGDLSVGFVGFCPVKRAPHVGMAVGMLDRGTLWHCQYGMGNLLVGARWWHGWIFYHFEWL